MKKMYTTVAVLLGIIANTTIYAQRKQDHTYSIHNYKHPNKAAEMKRIADEKPEVYLEEVNADAGSDNNLSAGLSNNYKAFNPERFRFKIFKVSKAPSINPFLPEPKFVNYKQQFPAREIRIPQPQPVLKRPEPVV